MKQSTNDSYKKEEPLSGLLKVYKEAQKNVPLLKYSWVIVATICLLSMAAYFKLDNYDVFKYALGVLLVSLFGFLFSYLLKTKDSFVKILLYILLSAITTTICAALLSFGSFILWEKPKFYSRWFPNYNDTGNKVYPIVPILPKDTFVNDRLVIDTSINPHVGKELTAQQLNDSAQAAYNLKDFATAFQYYEKSATLGDPVGEYKFGQMYEFGEGVKYNGIEAFKWYSKSANQGNAAGESKLASAYLNGIGVKADTTEAIKFFRKSADQGDYFAQSVLGYLYYSGLGVPQDLEEAANLFRRSAEQGYSDAENALGTMYENGIGGIKRNIPEAINWYQRSASQNNEQALTNLKRLNSSNSFDSHK